MQRPYKITYKTYFNDRLKEVDFHGKKTYPLYIQITYRKKTIFFKSYYFDLFSGQRYVLEKYGKVEQSPQISDVIDLELELIQFVIQRLEGEFSLEEFRTAYGFYGRDLCTYAEYFLKIQLLGFFTGEYDSFSSAIVSLKHSTVLYDFLQDMKKLFKDEIWIKLLQYCNDVARSYLPLYSFVLATRKSPYYYLSVMEWESAQLQENFKVYLESIEIYNEKQDDGIKAINQLVTYLQQE